MSTEQKPRTSGRGAITNGAPLATPLSALIGAMEQAGIDVGTQLRRVK